MDKGTIIYQEIIDELVKKSRSCVDANWAINGEAKGTGEHITKLNELFAKLTPKEREEAQARAKNPPKEVFCKIYLLSLLCH